MSKTSRIVIIGGSGFIGKKLAERFSEAGMPLLIYSSQNLNLLSPQASEKLSRELRKDDTVIFAAALTPDKGKDAHALYKNIQMAYNVSEVFSTMSYAQLIYISSDAVYGDDLNPVREGAAAAPSTLYGIGHRTREMILESATQKSKTPYLIIRPCAVYGNGDTHNSYGPNRFLRTALQEKKIVLFGAGEERRDHLYIEDLCELTWRAVHHITTGVINAATGHSYSFFEVASAVQDLLGGEVVIEQLPRQGGVVTHRHFDPGVLHKTFVGFCFTELRDGLKKSVQ